jgi:monofunctional biosynthetic peptidoglycan transglycosylase
MQRIIRVIAATLLVACLCLVALIALYRFVPPISTLMIGRTLLRRDVVRIWVPLDSISVNLQTASLISEDARFCRHHGVDWPALRDELGRSSLAHRSRGASTIAMQTAKNLFLWPARSVIRKGLEIPMALALDVAWPKRRLLEVYLNIAEWGEGIFGAEAAARYYFGKSAANLTAREAALLAAALPNPLHRDPRRPDLRQKAQANRIVERSRDAGPWLDCLTRRG